MTSKYFETPFANSGDKTSIPDATQPSGDVSFEKGWTPDYSNNQATDPNAKDIPRRSENYFKFAVTETLKEIQESGGKPYDPLVNYPVGALIQGSDGGRYLCRVKNGPGASFLPVVDPIDSAGNPNTWAPLDKTSAFTGGGGLIPGIINQLQDGSTYQLPDAQSLVIGAWVTVEIEDEFSSFTPLVESIGTDDITDIDGIDPDGEVLFNSLTSIRVRFTIYEITSGIKAWRI